MNSKLLALMVIVAGAFQVACSSDDGGSSQAFMSQCSRNQACIDQYSNAYKSVALTGTAAAQGLPQVAAPGSAPLQGQVPAVTTLPASVNKAIQGISDSQIREQANKIAATL